MTNPNDAPAFPGFDAPPYGSYRGMSLRDWFAGQALSGTIAGRSGWPHDLSDKDSCAEECYLLADAMLAQRDKA